MEMHTLMDNSFESDLDNILSKNENYLYLPWIGGNFKIQSKKIMIVAESVYLWGEGTEQTALQPNFGRIVLYDQGIDLQNRFKNKPMFQNFMKAFTGSNNIDINSKIEFWKSVVFHEFVQVPMLNRNIRPTQKDYIIGAKYLEELVQLSAPNTIIYFGTDWKKYISIRNAFLNLEYEIIGEKHSEVKINNSFPKILTLKKMGTEVKILFIKHPSRAFSSNLWHSFISENI